MPDGEKEDAVVEKHVQLRMLLSVLAICLAEMLLCQCHIDDTRRRPPNVPVTATFISAPKGAGVWQECRLDYGGAIHCRVFNRNGLILHDEPYVVYSGQVPKSADEIKISADGGEDYVLLASGTILIPGSNEAQMRRALDWLFGKRKTR